MYCHDDGWQCLLYCIYKKIMQLVVVSSPKILLRVGWISIPRLYSTYGYVCNYHVNAHEAWSSYLPFNS